VRTREPIQLVEIDVDRCTLVYGSAPCTAELGSTGVRKCYNTWRTCQAEDAYVDGIMTLRFASPTTSLPRGATIFPTVTSISERSATVNIGGSDSTLGPTGRRATVSVRLVDHPYHDRVTDPYARERVSGAAQVDEGGYRPEERGTFWSKFRARSPYFEGRSLRIIDAYVENGSIVNPQVRNYVISQMTGPDSDGSVEIEARDILNLADNDRAYAPAASNGALLSDMGDAATSLTLTPAGIGEEYPANGFVCIGSEVMGFDRMGDVLALNGRALFGSKVADHDAGDTVQLCLRYDSMRLDDVIQDLLCSHAKISEQFVPTERWAAEIGRWMPAVFVDTIIVKPEKVSTLLDELSSLGISIWWDAIEQEIGLKTVRPPDSDVLHAFSDEASNVSMESEDRPDERISRVLIYSVQQDVTQSATESNNYKRLSVSVDAGSEGVREHGSARTRVIYCRWFNSGADGVLAGIAARMLQRFTEAPVRYKVTVDAAVGSEASLTDVVSLQSRTITDVTGKDASRLTQIMSISDVLPGHSIEITLQSYPFNGRYMFITENDRPTYSASSEAQKRFGGYMVDAAAMVFPDGSGPYVII